MAVLPGLKFPYSWVDLSEGVTVQQDDLSGEVHGLDWAQAVPMLEDRDRAVEDAIHSVPAGGSSGQVLSKASAQDYDLTWAAGGGGGGGGLTMIQELSVSGVTFSFTSIPSTYRTLMVDASLRSNFANPSDSLMMRFNGDTGANYDWNEAEVLNGALLASSATATNRIFVGNVPAASVARATNYGTCRIVLQRYTDSSIDRVSISEAGFAAPGAASVTIYSTGHWANTAAITSLTFLMSSGSNFFGVATLYGQT